MVLLGHRNYEDVKKRSMAQEVVHLEEYDRLLNPATKAEHARKLSVKGVYPMLSLPYHSRVAQSFTDGMHTIKDVLCNIMDVILRKKKLFSKAIRARTRKPKIC